MTTKINKKITAVSVVNPDVPVPAETMHEKVVRPEVLAGRTYKIKTPLSEHALYITINDIVLNGTTAHPFEIFINCKAMEHFQWVTALTLTISAVFRKGGDVDFLVEGLKAIHDPKGGYFARGRYMPSLVAEIGEVIEKHLVGTGAIKKDASLADAAKAMVAEKSGGKKEATLCAKCNEVAVVLMDGCLTCTSCGSSHCG